MVSLMRNRKKFVLFNILSLLLFFASGQAFAWTQTATFESGANGAKASGSSGFSAAGTRTTFSSDMAHSGTKSAKMVWNKGDEGFDADRGELAYPSSVGNGGGVWIRGYYYFPAGWSWVDTAGSNTHVKTLRIAIPGAGFISFIIRSGGQIMYSNEPAAAYEENLNAYVDTGRWQCLELYVKMGNPGIVRMWKDGVLIKQDTSHTTGSSAVYSYIMSQWNNGPAQNQTEYLDDFIVTTDTPSGRDSAGNPMIGPTNGTSQAPLTAPTGLRIAAN